MTKRFTCEDQFCSGGGDAEPATQEIRDPIRTAYNGLPDPRWNPPPGSIYSDPARLSYVYWRAY